MARFRRIRSCLGVTQEEIALALEVTQGNVSYYERGQTLPPKAARRLITYAHSLGVALTYEHVYGDAELPPARNVTRQAAKA